MLFLGLARVQAITAIVAPTVIAPPSAATGGIASPSTIHASTAVITGDTWVISADSHDATCLCDQITSVCPTNPGKTATVMTAKRSRPARPDGTPSTASANGVIVRAPASITQAKYTIGSNRSRTCREKNQ